MCVLSITLHYVCNRDRVAVLMMLITMYWWWYCKKLSALSTIKCMYFY